MAKRKTRTMDTRGPLQRLHDRQAVERDQAALSVITPEQRAKGTYVGERRIVNNHDPVARWIALGRLTEGQQGAIRYVGRLWELSGLTQPLTANYGVSAGGGGCSELLAALEIDAREDLHRVRGYIPAGYWDVFENVCRWGEPAGVAGSALGFGERAGADRAHTIVCFVADVIAMKEGL